MTGHDIFAYFKKQTDEIEKNLFRAVILQEELPIHDLRVAIKRIRALFKFLKEQHISRPDTVFFIRQLNKIYNPLGHIRDLQIKSNLIKAFEKEDQEFLNDYSVRLYKKMEFSQLKVRKSRSSFSYATFLRLKKHKPFYPVQNIYLNRQQIISNRITRIRRHMRHENMEQHLHQIRKRLKEIYYCMEMSGLEHTIIHSTTLELQKIRKLEDTIGKWHDLHLFHQTLQPDNNNFFYSIEKAQLQKIRNDISNQNAKRSNYILNQLTQTIS